MSYWLYPDLVVGNQVEFAQTVYDNFGWEGNMPRATILQYIEDWNFIIRFHEEVWPRDREVSTRVSFDLNNGNLTAKTPLDRFQHSRKVQNFERSSLHLRSSNSGSNCGSPESV
jgi:hypothetical protein